MFFDLSYRVVHTLCTYVKVAMQRRSGISWT
jgi:hypothetical protein